MLLYVGMPVSILKAYLTEFSAERLEGLAVSFVTAALLLLLAIVVSTIASMNGPLAMIVLGIYLAQIPLKFLFTEGIVYKCTFVRLILIPALSIVLMMLIPKKYLMIKLAILITASAPVGSNVAIFAQLYDKDYTRAVKEVCMSTLFCIIIMPVMIGIAEILLWY